MTGARDSISRTSLFELVRLDAYTANLCAWETDPFFAASGARLEQFNSDQFHYRRAAFSSQLKSKIGNIFSKDEGLRINLEISTDQLSRQDHTLTHHTRKPLVTGY